MCETRRMRQQGLHDSDASLPKRSSCTLYTLQMFAYVSVCEKGMIASQRFKVSVSKQTLQATKKNAKLSALSPT